MINRYIYLLFIFCLCSLKLSAGIPMGTPAIKNFAPNEYKSSPDNWCIVQDKRGVIYVANTLSVMEFDGVNWTNFGNDNLSIIRSLAVTDDNIIYVGSEGEIGRLVPENGKLKYNSLNSLIKKNKDFKEVWKTYSIGKEIVFQTNTQLFIYNGSNIYEVRPQAGKNFHFSYVVNNKLYVLEKETGIMVLEDKKLHLIEGGGNFKDDKLYCMLEFSKDEFLIGTKDKGLFILNKNGKVTPFKSEISNSIVEDFLYGAVKIGEDKFALATIKNGAYIINKKGEVIQHFSKQNGLQDQMVKCIFYDNQQGLWLGLDRGITRIEISSPLSFFGEKDGIQGRVESVCEFNNYIYVSSSKGVYYSKISEKLQQTFKPISEINSPSWGFEVVKKLNAVFVSTQQGLFQIKGETATLTYPYHTFCSKFLNDSLNTLLIGLRDGLASLQYKNNTWKNELYFDSIPYEIRKIEIDKFNTIWLGTSVNGIIALTSSSSNSKLFLNTNKRSVNNNNYNIYFFDKSNNFDNLRFALPFNTRRGMVFSTLGELLEFDYKTDKFHLSNWLIKGFPNYNIQVQPISEDSEGNFWVSVNQKNLSRTFKFKNENEIKKGVIAGLDNQIIYSIFNTENHHSLISVSEGIYCYNNLIKNSTNKNFNTLISLVSAGNDTIYEGYPGNEFIFNKNISYSNNDFVFSFSSTSFDDFEKNQFSYYLEGLDDTWKAFTKENRVQYLKLTEGTYVFHVKSQNVYGQFSNEATFSFVLNPPWYRSKIAYIFYLLSLVGLIYLIVKISVYRLTQAKIKLEALVKDRTIEISQQKEIVENQKLIVELKNKDITDSIKYAKRIQQAILPVQEDIFESFKDSFLFYKPRDIVSGDFYWFSKINEFEALIAVVDCTGHGVPGAFMSMIGHTLLNEIVNEKKIYQPNLILNELHLSVRTALKQNQVNTESRDGMDMALIKINSQTKTVEYAGANRPLYVINSIDGLQEYKADKLPIGGLQLREDETREFNLNTIEISTPSWLYFFTDGFPDQFGGPEGKKFMVKKLKELLLEASEKPGKEQKEILAKTMENWMGSIDQIDDILLIGIQIK